MRPNTVRGCGEFYEQEKAEDFVIATGQTNTVKEFCKFFFKHLGVVFRVERQGSKRKEELSRS